MPSNVIVNINPLRLNATIAKAFKASVYAAGADAKAHAPNRGSGVIPSVRGNVGYLRPTGFGIIFEKGRQGGYEINPGLTKGVRRSYSKSKGSTYSAKIGKTTTSALKFVGGDGGFAAYAIGGPMSARPYVGPAGARWARGGCQAVMRTTLISGGFR